MLARPLAIARKRRRSRASRPEGAGVPRAIVSVVGRIAREHVWQVEALGPGTGRGQRRREHRGDEAGLLGGEEVRTLRSLALVPRARGLGVTIRRGVAALAAVSGVLVRAAASRVKARLGITCVIRRALIGRGVAARLRPATGRIEREQALIAWGKQPEGALEALHVRATRVGRDRKRERPGGLAARAIERGQLSAHLGRKRVEICRNGIMPRHPPHRDGVEQYAHPLEVTRQLPRHAPGVSRSPAGGDRAGNRAPEARQCGQQLTRREQAIEQREQRLQSRAIRAQRDPPPASRRRDPHFTHRLPQQQQDLRGRLVIAQTAFGNQLQPDVCDTIAHPPVSSVVQLDRHAHHGCGSQQGSSNPRLATCLQHTHHTTE